MSITLLVGSLTEGFHSQHFRRPERLRDSSFVRNAAAMPSVHVRMRANELFQLHKRSAFDR